ncbi:MAG: hypothetical protein ACMZI0_15010 [Symbiopectobacterium sp.]|uniref:hypothetical protein n=1 Tax=Symbiopectobacterium sp. TaxID=2952789 RepID=UPI0039E9AC0C
MSKHTEGLWVFGVKSFTDGVQEKPYTYNSGAYYNNPGIYGANGNEVVRCDEYYIFSNRADIALLVSAPDLFEALESLLELAVHNEVKIYGEWGMGRTWNQIKKDGDAPEEILKAIAAIAKAKGES